MHDRPRWLLVFTLTALGLASCSPSPSPPLRARPGPAAPASAAPELADSCPVAITVALAGTGPRRELVVSAENRHTQVQELVLPDQCPSGPVEFTGLPGCYDYYGACAMGACVGERAPIRVGLGVGERRELARTTLELGASSCNAPVPAGEYRLSAAIPGVAPECIVGATLVVDETPTPPAPSPAPEPASPSANIDFQACTADGDCIVHCPNVSGCCGWSCGCTNAINKAHEAAFDAHYARTCARAPNCPAMGCAYEPHHFARCVDNRCRSFAGLSF